MAIYHTRVKTFSRAQGHASTAAAAYRGGCLSSMPAPVYGTITEGEGALSKPAAWRRMERLNGLSIPDSFGLQPRLQSGAKTLPLPVSSKWRCPTN